MLNSDAEYWWLKFESRWESVERLATDTADLILSAPKKSYTKHEVGVLIRDMWAKMDDCGVYSSVENLYNEVPDIPDVAPEVGEIHDLIGSGFNIAQLLELKDIILEYKRTHYIK